MPDRAHDGAGTQPRLGELGEAGKQTWRVGRRAGSGNHIIRETDSGLHLGLGSDPKPGAAVTGLPEPFEWALSEPGEHEHAERDDLDGDCFLLVAPRDGLLPADDHVRTSTEHPQLVTATPPTTPLYEVWRFSALHLDQLLAASAPPSSAS